MPDVLIKFKSQGANKPINAMEKLEQRILALVKAFEQLDSITIDFVALSKGAGLAATEIARIEKAIAKYKKEAKAAAAPNERLGDSFKRYGDQVDGLGNKVDSLAARQRALAAANQQISQSLGRPVREIEALNAALGTTPQETQKIVAAYTSLRGAGNNLNETQKSLSRSLGVTEQQFKTLNQRLPLSAASLQQIALASGALAAGIGGIFAKGGASFLEFDRALKGVEVRSGGTAEEIAAVREEAARLGSESSKTAIEVAQTADQLTRAGFSAGEVTDSLEGVVRAAEGSGESVQVVGDVVSKTIRQFGLSAEDASNVADVLVTSANSANVTVSSLGQALKFAGPAARAANQSLEDTAFFLNLAGDAGLQGGQGGRNFTAALTSLTKAASATNTTLDQFTTGPARKAAEAVEILGVELSDSEGNMRSLREVFPEIAASLGQLSAADRNVVGRALFGNEQGDRFAKAIAGLSDDHIAGLVSQFENLEGAAVDSGLALQEGLPGAIDQLGSAFEGLTLEFFDEFSDDAEVLVRAATDMIRGFSELDPAIKGLVIRFTALIGILSAAIAAYSAFQAVQGTKIATQIAENAGLVTSNALKQANVLATLAQAAATGKLDAAQKATIKNYIGMAKTGGLALAAVAAIAVAADTFNKVTKGAGETREATDDVTDALLDLDKELAKTNETAGATSIALGGLVETELERNLRKASDELGTLQKALDFVRVLLDTITLNRIFEELSKFEQLPEPLRAVFEGIANFIPDIATAAEASATRQNAAFGDLVIESDKVLARYDDMKGALAAGDVSTEAIDKQKSAIESAISALEAEEPITKANIKQRELYIQSLQTAKEELEATIAAQGDEANAIDQTTEQLGNITQAYEAAATDAEAVEEAKQLEIAKIRADGSKSAEEVEALQLDATIARINSQIQAERDKISQLEALAAEGGNQQVDQSLTEAKNNLIKLETEVLEAEAEKQKGIRESQAEQIQSTFSEASDAIKLAETQRSIEIQQLVNAGAIDETKAQKLRLKAVKDRITQELEAEQARVSALQALPKSGDAGERAQQEAEIRGAIQATADLQLQLLEAEQDLQEQLIQAALASIEKERQAKEIKSNEAIRGLEAEAAAQDAITRSLDTQLRLNQQASNLAAARSSLASTESNIRIKALQDELTLAELRGASDKETADIEAAIAAEKLASKERELQVGALQAQLARDAFDLEIQREQAAARRFVLEQQSAALQAEQNLINAKAQLAGAEAEGDEQAVALAQDAVSAAEAQVGKANELVTAAQEQERLLEESIPKRREILALQQEETAAVLEAAVAEERRAQAIEKARKEKDRESGSSGNNRPRRFRQGGQLPSGEMVQVHRGEYVVGPSGVNQLSQDKLMVGGGEYVVSQAQSSLIRNRAKRMAREFALRSELGGLPGFSFNLSQTNQTLKTKADPRMMKELRSLNSKLESLNQTVRSGKGKVPMENNIFLPVEKGKTPTTQMYEAVGALARIIPGM